MLFETDQFFSWKAIHRARTESDCNDIVLGKLFYIRRFVQTFRILEITKQTI